MKEQRVNLASLFPGGRMKTILGAAGGIVLLLLVAVVLGGGGPPDAAAAPMGETASRPPVLVQYAQARKLAFFDSISADGELKSRYYALVSPRISGVIDDIYVREGDRAEQGKTVLFQIENEKLSQAVDHARQSLVIARSTVDEKQASLAKVQADHAKAEKDCARNRFLYEKKVVSLSELEVHETKLMQLEAEMKVAETNLVLARQNISLAEITLKMSEKDLRDSIMYAPIDGFVSERHSEPGEMGTPGNSIVRIDGTHHLKAVAYLPGQYFPRIDIGDSIAAVQVHGKKIDDFPISYKAPGIDSSLRTFEIWADVPGDGRHAVFGAQCVITVILRETKGIGVPRDAVQYRDGRYWVFVPDGKVAKMIEIKPGLETDGWTELLDSPLGEGGRVIVEGQFLLEDGHPIRERDGAF